jgi:hypothetical protein
MRRAWLIALGFHAGVNSPADALGCAAVLFTTWPLGLREGFEALTA